MDGVPLIVEPDQDYPDCATVLVDGTIARRPYRFVLDTGAARTHIIADDELARLPQRGSQARIGDRIFAPHRAFVADLPQDVGHMDLVLGYPAIRQAVWVFDFPARRWAFE